MIDIVIVNWNSGCQLADCLASVEAHGGGLVNSVVVVDNGSNDGSAEEIEKRFDLPLRVVRNRENLGFAAASNQGAACGLSPYILFLNPDARLFQGSLSKALSAFERQIDVGIVGIQLIDESGEVARTCARFPTLANYVVSALGLDRVGGFRRFCVHMRDWDHKTTRKVDHVIGAFYLIRRELFGTLRGFDERFFVYLEDLDLSLRARNAGFQTLFLAEAQAFHAGGGSSRKVKARRLYYSLRSRLLYGFKHFTPTGAIVLLMLTLLLEPVTRLVFALGRGRVDDAGHTLVAYRLLLGDLPAILRRARRAGVNGGGSQREMDNIEDRG